MTVLLVVIGIPKYNEYQEEKKEAEENQQEALEDFKKVQTLYQGDFYELAKNEDLNLNYNPTSENTLENLPENNKKEYEEMMDGFEKSEEIYKSILSANKGYTVADIMNSSAQETDTVKEEINNEIKNIQTQISELPENQQNLFNTMIDDLQTEFNFYNGIYSNYFGTFHNFHVASDGAYRIFSEEKQQQMISEANELTPKSPYGFQYFGLDTIEKDINAIIIKNKKDSAKYYNEIDSDKREYYIDTYWKQEGGKYCLYLSNISSDYIKFAEEALAINYNQFNDLYLHTKQFKDTRSGLDELNRVSYGEQSRSGYTWTVFTLAPNQTEKIGTISAEKFEKVSYDGQLVYRYNNKTIKMGGVPRMNDN